MSQVDTPINSMWTYVDTPNCMQIFNERNTSISVANKGHYSHNVKILYERVY